MRLTFRCLCQNGAPTEDGTASDCNSFKELSDFDILRSVSFSPSGLNQSVATYTLDQNASSVFIHTKGDASTGMVQIVGSDDNTLMNASHVKPGTIRVDVIMRSAYNQTKALVCKMQKDNGGQGVGVYVSVFREQARSSTYNDVNPIFLDVCHNQELRRRNCRARSQPLICHYCPTTLCLFGRSASNDTGIYGRHRSDEPSIRGDDQSRYIQERNSGSWPWSDQCKLPRSAGHIPQVTHQLDHGYVQRIE